MIIDFTLKLPVVVFVYEPQQNRKMHIYLYNVVT